MGENGAGKSTLLKILSGFQAPTRGVVKLAGQEKVFQNTVDALESGIAIIYQELHLVPEMSVAENIYLGQLPTRRGVIDREKLYQDAARQLARLGMDVSPETPLKYLSLGQWQMVEIAKALTRDASVIAFDEPTSSLSSREIEQLFRVIRQLRDEGKVILYVSHRMDEIFRPVRCHHGVQGWPVRAHLRFHGRGGPGSAGQDHGGARADRHLWLQPKAAWRGGPQGGAPDGARPQGAGVARGKRGRSSASSGWWGRAQRADEAYLRRRDTSGGEISVFGKQVVIQSPIDAIRSGIMLCTEDRKALGIIPIHSVQENINISARRHHAWGGFWINQQWEDENARLRIRDMRVKTPSPSRPS
jgi:L-arabinose transport system ATP-binding protein